MVNLLAALYETAYCCADTETTGLVPYGHFLKLGYYPARPFAFSFTTYEGVSLYVRFEVNPYTRRVMYERDYSSYLALKTFFEDPKVDKVFHNANFDIIMLKHIGIEVRGKVWDTLTMAHVDKCNRREFGLKPLTEEIFGWPTEDQSDLQAYIVKRRRDGKKLGYKLAEDVEADYWLDDSPEEYCKKYAIGDTERTRYLFIGLKARYDEDSEYASVVDMEHRLLETTRNMMLRGHRIDENKIDELIEYYGKSVINQKQKIVDLGYSKLNPNSPKQLQHIFYGDPKLYPGSLGLPPIYKIRKKKGGLKEKTITCDLDALASMSAKVPLAKALVELSSAEHQLDSFMYPFKQMGVEESPGVIVLHPNYKNNGPITGRLSCSKPNLMNISSKDSPKKRAEDVDYRARECFIPRDGHLLYFFDYEQIEVWASAFLSQDPIMMKVLLEGGDMHAITAKACFGHHEDFEKNFKKYRKKSKFVNFGSIYGAGVSALQVQAECSYEEAVYIHTKFWETYEGLGEYSRRLQYEVRRKGYVVNPFGRRYHVDSDLAFKILNYMVQGSCADVIKRAMINVENLFSTKRWGGNYLQLTIHDELGMEIREQDHGVELMQDIVFAMQANFHDAFAMPKPFKVSPSFTTTSWYSKIELDENFCIKEAA